PGRRAAAASSAGALLAHVGRQIVGRDLRHLADLGDIVDAGLAAWQRAERLRRARLQDVLRLALAAPGAAALEDLDHGVGVLRQDLRHGLATMSAGARAASGHAGRAPPPRSPEAQPDARAPLAPLASQAFALLARSARRFTRSARSAVSGRPGT